MKHHRLSFLLTLLCLAVGAQTAIASSPDIRFRLMPWDTTPNDLYIATADGHEQLRGVPNQLSHEYQYSGDSPLVLYRMQTQADAPPVFTPLQAVPFTSDTQHYILFLFRPENPQAQQHAVLYPFNQTDGFRSGLTIFNFTSHPVAAQIGEQLVNLNPQQSHAIPATSLPLDNFAFLCKIAGSKGNQWRLIYNNFINIPPNTSVLFFIASDPATDNESDELKIITKRVVDYNLSEATRRKEVSVERIGTDINY